MDHGQGAGHKTHQEKAPPLPLVDRPAQQIQRREQHRPAKQRSPLGEHHIHQHVDPADVLPHQVGGRLVKGGEDAGEVFHTAAQKVEKPKAPVEGEEHPGQGRLGPALCHGGEKGVQPKEHLGPRRPHGQLVGKPQRRAQLVQAGGDAVRQKGVGEPGAGQQGVVRGEVPLVCQAGQKAQVHAHVPVGGLAGVHRAALPAEGVPHQKAEKHPDAQHHPQEFPPGPGGEGLSHPKTRAGKAAAARQRPGGQRQRYPQPQPLGQGGEAHSESQQRRQPLEQHAAPHAAHQQPHPGALPRQRQAGQAQAAGLIAPKEERRQQRPLQSPLHETSSPWNILPRVRTVLYHFPGESATLAKPRRG